MFSLLTGTQLNRSCTEANVLISATSAANVTGADITSFRRAAGLSLSAGRFAGDIFGSRMSTPFPGPGPYPCG